MSTALRTVVVCRYLQRPPVDGVSPPLEYQEMGRAKFHCFTSGTDPEFSPNPYPAAILEWDDGMVCVMPAEWLRFDTPTRELPVPPAVSAARVDDEQLELLLANAAMTRPKGGRYWIGLAEVRRIIQGLGEIAARTGLSS